MNIAYICSICKTLCKNVNTNIDQFIGIECNCNQAQEKYKQIEIITKEVNDLEKLLTSKLKSIQVNNEKLLYQKYKQDKLLYVNHIQQAINLEEKQLLIEKQE